MQVNAGIETKRDQCYLYSSKKQMEKKQINNPLHGITLEAIVKHLVNYFGWEGLAIKININCFKSNPTIKSSLTFLRKTPWAREKVENLYLWTLRHKKI
jgi:uncharacterized protein (DUF2132 family)